MRTHVCNATRRYYKEMAEVFEADNNLDMAMESYQQAADMFSNDNKKSNANQCLLKVGAILVNVDSFRY